MFDFIRKALRAKQNEDKAIGADNALGQTQLRLGGTVRLDSIAFSFLENDLLFRAPAGDQPVDAYGLVDLGASAELHRYYLTDDAWVQVNVTDDQIDEIKYWIFYETKHPATRDAFDRWFAVGGQIGGKSLSLEGKTYTRVWGEEASWAPPIPLIESVYADSMDAVNYQTHHHAMLYERPVAGSDRMEYLLVSAELTDGEYCVVFNVGVDVTLADLMIN